MTADDQSGTTPKLVTNGKLSPLTLVPISNDWLLQLIDTVDWTARKDSAYLKFWEETRERLRALDCLTRWIVPRKPGSSRPWPMHSVFGSHPTSIEEAQWLAGRIIDWFALRNLDLFVWVGLEGQPDELQDEFTAPVASLEQFLEVVAYRNDKAGCDVLFVAPLFHRLVRAVESGYLPRPS